MYRENHSLLCLTRHCLTPSQFYNLLATVELHGCDIVSLEYLMSGLYIPMKQIYSNKKWFNENQCMPDMKATYYI